MGPLPAESGAFGSAAEADGKRLQCSELEISKAFWYERTGRSSENWITLDIIVIKSKAKNRNVSSSLGGSSDVLMY